MRRLSLIGLMSIAIVILAISPARAAGGWMATATTLDLIGGPTRTAAFLAPDGSRFAYVKGKDLCIYTLTGEKGDCVTLPDDAHMDLETVRWSPDSTKLVFSEDFFITFRDSDIWLYDADTNTLKDLTLDPFRTKIKNFLTNSDPKVIFTVDVVPQWAADSQSIYFIRYSFSTSKQAQAHFSKLKLSDQTVEEIGAVSSTFSFASYGFAVSPDDKTIAYNLDTHKAEKDGTWLLDLATNKAAFAAAPLPDTAPWAYQFSADGTQLLSIGVDATGMAETRKPETSPIYTLPVKGGDLQHVSSDAYVFAAGWGPKDAEMAYATFDRFNPDSEGLFIASAPDQPGERVLPGRFIAPTPRVRTPIYWAANNTIILSQAPEFKLVVVQLTPS